MEKEQLTKAGMKVLAELHNERINDHLFVIRDIFGSGALGTHLISEHRYRQRKTKH